MHPFSNKKRVLEAMSRFLSEGRVRYSMVPPTRNTPSDHASLKRNLVLTKGAIEGSLLRLQPAKMSALLYLQQGICDVQTQQHCNRRNILTQGQTTHEKLSGRLRSKTTGRKNSIETDEYHIKPKADQPTKKMG